MKAGVASGGKLARVQRVMRAAHRRAPRASNACVLRRTGSVDGEAAVFLLRAI